MSHTLDAVLEIFTWAGFGLGAAAAGLALILYLVDGTWVPVRGYVETADGRRIVRWFDETDTVNEAELSASEAAELGDDDTVDVFARRGTPHRMRLHRRSPAVRAAVIPAVVLLGVGALALVTSLVVLFARG